MAFTVPTFNLFMSVWNAGLTPAADAPSFENVGCQFYLYSRGTFDVQPCELEVYTPPIWIRMSIDDIAIWESGQIFEVAATTGRYYRARFKERMHYGFSNQYLIVVVVQCNEDGIPLLRDIEDAEPCGGGGGGGVGGGDIGAAAAAQVDGEGTQSSGGGGGTGDGEIFTHAQHNQTGAGTQS